MRYAYETTLENLAANDFRHCGGCGALYHLNEVYQGRGRRLWEHPDHQYAPCGCSQTWFDPQPAFLEMETTHDMEFHREDDELP